MKRIFISYSRQDCKIAEQLYNDLVRAGQRPWLDTVNLKPGENWEFAIREQIRTCDYFLALLSNHSLNNRGFVQKELRLGLESLQEYPIEQIFLIPVRLERCYPKDRRLAELNWVDLFPDYLTGLKRILAVVQEGKPMTNFYAKVGIEIPKEFSGWPYELQLEFFQDTLWPELHIRAERQYEHIEVDDIRQSIFIDAVELGERVARAYGFEDAWGRYLADKRLGAT